MEFEELKKMLSEYNSPSEGNSNSIADLSGMSAAVPVAPLPAIQTPNIDTSGDAPNAALTESMFHSAPKSESKGEGGGDMMGTVMKIAPMALMALSDKNKKSDIKDGSSKIEELLNKLNAYEFSYKDDPKKEKNMGIMAQDLEKSRDGKAAVKNTKDGKMLDVGKTNSIALAALANIHKRLKHIEGK